MSVNSTIDHCKAPNRFTYEVLSWVMVVEYVLGLPLNLSVLYIFIFRYKFWKNKSIFLFNIVVADFLLMVCLPAKGPASPSSSRSPSTDTSMWFISGGNFVKVLKKTPQFSILIWVLLLPLTIPTMVNTLECCNSLSNETFLNDVTDLFREIVYFAQIIIPFIILVYCTVRIVNRLRRKTVSEKTKLRRAVLAVISVVVVFTLCFLPITIARAVLLVARLQYDSLMVLSYIDCLLDPLVYCFCISGFKDAYISTFCPTFLTKKLLKAEQPQ
ncbi:hypothetical protein JOQ06_027746 [Pogonophryne albipinna]|uniref:G-protein coupled receptors family 1 profile domain-containing protein n=1 Tax=Pogonophryne albipinna TaxID=1090488 RepID=A0AAD6F4K5_9TELE|nr:hypothetical protein JOQ06_027746 [Pogonophryne albipinna]